MIRAAETLPPSPSSPALWILCILLLPLVPEDPPSPRGRDFYHAFDEGGARFFSSLFAQRSVTLSDRQSSQVIWHFQRLCLSCGSTWQETKGGGGHSELCFGSPLLEAAKTYRRLLNHDYKEYKEAFDCKSKSNNQASVVIYLVCWSGPGH